MSWLRRLSRDRSSKQEQDFDNSTDHRAASYRPQTSYGGASRKISASKDSQFPSDPSSKGDDAMYRNSAPAHYDQHPMGGGGGGAGAGGAGGAGGAFTTQRGMNNTSNDAINNVHGSPRGIPTRSSQPMSSASYELVPDPLARAFSEALKPYLEQINALKADLESANQTIASLSSEHSQLNSERAALHTWIDKRGLRPDLPPSLAATFPASSVAASTLSTQLDRKMTMLNYSLHHLADSAPEPLPASTVTSTLQTLLPPIQHLASLPNGGPAFAFETLIKLAGNLNSHSTGEETEADRAEIADFYDRLDEAMAGVVGRRFHAKNDGAEDWDVSKDVKRLDKTGSFLRKEMGVGNYFVRSLELMKDGLHGGMFGGGGGGGGGGAHQQMYDDHGR